MAPEQLAGKEVSVRSDIYALGLVLYEMFTGRHAFPAGSAAELIRLQEQTTPAGPSTIVPGLDPAVERVILRCLDKDPDKRPRSAMAVAAALPGGDPIAAALAAGETPAPELLAEAGVSRGLSPGLAWACLAASFVALALVVALASQTRFTSLVKLENPPAVLIKKSRDLIALLGPGEPVRDSSFGYLFDRRYFDEIAATDRSPNRWAQLSDPNRPPVAFWYRQSPQVLNPIDERRIWPNVGDPPVLLPGMESVLLDSTGRLQMIYRVPPRYDGSVGPLARSRLEAAPGRDRGRSRKPEARGPPLDAAHEHRQPTGVGRALPRQGRVDGARGGRRVPGQALLPRDLSAVGETAKHDPR